MRGRDLPVAVPALIGGLALASLVTGLAGGFSQPVVAWWVLLPLLAALVMGGQLQIHFQYRGHVEAMDLFEAALLPVILIFPGAGAVLLAAVAKAVSQRMMRVAPIKAAFNVAQWAAAAGVASLVYVSLGGGHLAGSARTGAVVAGMVAGMLVNHLSVALVIALAQRLPLRTALGDLAPIIVPIWMIGGVVNLSFGVLIATLVLSQPSLAPLALVPLASLHWAQRAFAEARADHARVEALHQATHALAEPVDPFEAVPKFVEVVRDCFEAAAADLVMFDDASKLFHAGESGTEDLSRELARKLTSSRDPVRVTAGDGSPAGTLLSKAGRRNCLAAELHGGGRIHGLLVSYDRAGLEGFEAGEMAVFGALAGEVSNALQKSALLSALLSERAHLFDIVDRSSDGIFAIGSDGVLETWNPAMAAITGFTSEELAGAPPLAVLNPLGPDGRLVVFERWSDRHSQALPGDIEIRTRAGAQRWLACSYATTAPRGEVSATLVVVARDVTRQRELDRMKDDFVYTVSHELRTPLTSIGGYTSMLLEPSYDLSEEQRHEALVSVRKASHRLERLICNLLEVSVLEARGLTQAPIDVEEIVGGVVAEARREWWGREITVHHDLGALRARGNSLSVEQVLQNLIANAMKYGADSAVDVSVIGEPGAVAIRVADNGPGVSPQYHERIFERFERLDQSTVQAGTGLGLYISRRLARAMGGELSLENAPGHGATFCLRLPAQVVLTERPRTLQLSEPVAGGSPSNGSVSAGSGH